MRLLVQKITPSKFIDTNGELLEALQPQSETLQNITDMFVPLMRNFRIYFFWEQEKTDLKGGYDYVSKQRDLYLEAVGLTQRRRSYLNRRRLLSSTTRNAVDFPMTIGTCAGSTANLHPDIR